MNLRRRHKRKKDQALDAVASVTKLWSEWQLGKKASKGVAKAKELRPPSKLKRVLSLKWIKIGGGVAVAGGAAAAVATKLKGEKPEDYTGPPPSVAADAAVPAPDTPAPLAVAPDPATQERDTESASGPSALAKNRDEPAADAGDEAPAAVGDAAEETPDAAEDPPEPAAGAESEDESAAFPTGPSVDPDEGDAPAATGKPGDE